MASFYSEKSLVKKKRRKANGVNRSRIQREQRERERIRREKEELLKLKRYNAATTISAQHFDDLDSDLNNWKTSIL